MRVTKSQRKWLFAGLATIVAFLGTEAAQSHATQAQLDERVQALSAHLGVAFASHLESLYALQALFQTPTIRVTGANFSKFSEEFLKRYPEVTAVEWFPFVPETDRAHFEEWMRETESAFKIWAPANGMASPEGQPHTHIPLTYSAPSNPSILGLDLVGLDDFGMPARESVERAKVTASDRCHLVEDPKGVLSVVTYAPVRDSSWAGDPGPNGREYRDGVLVLIFRLESLTKSALAHLDLKGLALRLEDTNARHDRRDLHQIGTLTEKERAKAQFAFADRIYEMTVAPSIRRSPLPAFGAALAVFLMSAAWIRLMDLRTRARQLSQTVETLGQYKLEQRIATGGMGTVYRAQHALLKRPAAIKIAHKDQSSAHFEREARLHSTLTHPNTVTVFDFGCGEDGTFYVAMEYVEGYDLYRLVTLHGPQPAGRVARILIQAAASLVEAHSKGLIHRDVKPSNVMITERGGIRDFVKVLDFGLARSSLAGTASLNSASMSTLFVGTPGYIAPEVIVGAAASAASDIFSLGCVAYFLLTGRGAFDDTSPVATLGRVIGGNQHSLPEGTPKLLAEFIERCLQKRPEDRPLGMGSVVEQLRTIIPQLPPWTPEDAEHFWRKHPSVLPQSEDRPGFSVVLQNARSTGTRP